MILYEAPDPDPPPCACEEGDGDPPGHWPGTIWRCDACGQRWLVVEDGLDDHWERRSGWSLDVWPRLVWESMKKYGREVRRAW